MKKEDGSVDDMDSKPASIAWDAEHVAAIDGVIQALVSEDTYHGPPGERQKWATSNIKYICEQGQDEEDEEEVKPAAFNKTKVIASLTNDTSHGPPGHFQEDDSKPKAKPTGRLYYTPSTNVLTKAELRKRERQRQRVKLRWQQCSPTPSHSAATAPGATPVSATIVAIEPKMYSNIMKGRNSKDYYSKKRIKTKSSSNERKIENTDEIEATPPARTVNTTTSSRNANNRIRRNRRKPGFGAPEHHTLDGPRDASNSDDIDAYDDPGEDKSEEDVNDDNALDLDAPIHITTPGAERVLGIFGSMSNSESSNPPLSLRESQSPYLATAFTVDETQDHANIARAEVVKKPIWSRRRLAILLVVLILAVTGTGVGRGIHFPGAGGRAIIVTSNPTSNPTFSPTLSPTDRELAWVDLGDEIENTKGFGQDLDASNDGLVVISSAPVDIREFNGGIWRQIPIRDDLNDTTLRSCRSVAMSGNGEVVAVGVPVKGRRGGNNNHTNINVSYVQAFVARLDRDRSRAEFVPMGATLMAPDEGKTGFGSAISLSDDGSRLAVGAGQGNECFADVYEYSDVSKQWVTIGPGLGCLGSSLYFGTTVKLSKDGRSVAIGTPIPQEIGNNENLGNVTVLEWNAPSNSWNPMGQLLRAASGTDEFGSALDFGNDGLTIAIGVPFHDRQSATGRRDDDEPNVGAVRVYDFSLSDNAWTERRRQDSVIIEGLVTFDNFGTSVALSEDGNTLALGAAGSSTNGPKSGLVGVLRYVEDENNWEVLGDYIVGHGINAGSGSAVSLSSDGSVVAYTSPFDDERSPNPSSVQVKATGSILNQDNGDVQVRVRVEFAAVDILADNEEGNVIELSWHIERLDARGANGGEVFVDSFGLRINNTNITTLSQSTNTTSGGLYRLMLDSGKLGSRGGNVTITENRVGSDKEDEMEVFRGLLGEFGEVTFGTSPRESLANEILSNQTRNEGATLLLLLDFDDNPEEVHWILTAKWRYEEVDTSRTRQARSVVAFGPIFQYSKALRRSQVEEMIDISQFPPDARFELVLVDVGRNGLCCDYGEGMYRLYNGSEPLDSNLLVNGTAAEAKFGRRISHQFGLSGPLLDSSSISPTAAPEAS